MKLNQNFRQCLRSLLVGTALATSLFTARAQNILIDFGTNSIWYTNASVATWQWWGGCTTVREWATNDVADDPESGSLKISVTWPAETGGANDFQYSIGMSLSGEGTYNGAITVPTLSFTNIEMDILWDTTASTADIVDHQDGQNGGDPNGFGIGVAGPSWGQTWVPNADQPRLAGNGTWEHVNIPINPAWPSIPGLIFKKWRSNSNAGATNLVGKTSVFYIDNIRFGTNPVPPVLKPTLRFTPATKGLNITAAQPGQQYQRESVRSIPADAIQWYGNPDPVTYSWTIAEFPPRTQAPGFFATLFLAPDGNGSDTPDWDAPNCIVIETSLNANNEGTCLFRFKTNAPAANGVLYGVGALGTLTDPRGVLGTWSATFTNNSFCTLKGPSGVSLTVDMGAEAAAFFQTLTPSMTTYFGFQPGGADNIGNRGVYSRLKVENGNTVVVDDTFLGPDIDFNNWIPAFQAPDETAYKVVDQDGAFWLSWNKPDGFFSFIASSSDVTTGWVDSGLPVLDLGARTGTFIDTNFLANFPNQVYFKLIGTNTP
ncbi:MAG TPA: hypothetical protein VFZ59_02605 [Verrucomicrobiae bacterium]|nr:hypothetical protein [Verrucomicrobiae bacterium]